MLSSTATRNRPLKAVLSLIMILGIVAASCGGDDSDAGASDGSSEAGQSDGSGEADDGGSQGSDDGASSDDDSGSNDAGSKTASVTIDGETYTADLSRSLTVCVSMGGALGASGAVDGIDGSNLDISLPPEGADTTNGDWDPPSIRLDLGEDENGTPVDLRAGGDVMEMFAENIDLEGKSQVDSYEIDGRTARGTATFIDSFQVQLAMGGQIEELEPVQGTFEVNCG